MNFVRDVSWVFGSRLINFVIGIGISVIVARNLGPAGKGILTLVLLIPTTIFCFTHLGIPQANVYFLNRKKKSLKSIIDANGPLLLVISIISISIYAVGVLVLRHNLLKQVHVNLLIVASFFLLFLLFKAFFSSILQAYRWMKENSLIGMLETGAHLLFLIVAIYLLHLSIMGALLATVLSSLFGCFLLSCYVKKLSWQNSGLNSNTRVLIAKKKLIDKKQVNLTKNLLSFGRITYISGIFWFLILRIDMYMISYFRGVTDLGYYSLSVSLAEKLWLIPASIGTVLFPVISGMKHKEGSEFVAKTIRVTMWMMIVLGTISMILAKPFIVTLYSKNFSPSITPFRLLITGVIAFSIWNFLTDTFIGWGRPKVNVYLYGIVLVVNIIMNMYFIPQWGISGAAFSSLIAYILGTLISIFIFLRLSNLRLSKLLFLKQEDLSFLFRKMFKINQKI